MKFRIDSEKLASFAFATTMIAVGGFAWWLHLGPNVYVDASPLTEVPTRIGSWESREIPVQSSIQDVLRADINLQRAYRSPLGDVVWLYVGYYGTERGGRPEHTPRGCYTGAGWGIESSRTLSVSPDQRLRVNEYLIQRGEERRLVHFWYRSHRRTGLLGGFDQNLDRMLGQLLQRRADGALIRISTSIQEPDATMARGRLLSFASLVDPLLGQHWPIEHPCDYDDPDACGPDPNSPASTASEPELDAKRIRVGQNAQLVLDGAR